MITIADIKSVLKGISVSDNIIQMYIDTVEQKIGECLNGYDEPLRSLIAINLVAHLIAVATGQYDVTSRRAPNGASLSYSKTEAKDGILGTRFGKTVFDLDSRGCYKAIVVPRSFVFSVGAQGRKG